jgi:hypothetical protein
VGGLGSQINLLRPALDLSTEVVERLLAGRKLIVSTPIQEICERYRD